MRLSSDREGERIEDYSATAFEEDGDAMTCECAWTRRYLADGVTKPLCCDNGNFKGYQCQVTFCESSEPCPSRQNIR